MEDLCSQVKERAQRNAEVARGNLAPERLRSLKEEERSRVEKQNFILSMLRANKSHTALPKGLYYRCSCEMMKAICPSFAPQISYDRLEENFLNDFVGLYRIFFYQFEDTFNFKVKLQALIRPTNHNLIIDLVRYLVDFSRDYYQQTFFWLMKSTLKVQKIEEEEEPTQQTEDTKMKKARTSLNQLIFQRESSKKSDEGEKGQKDYNKIYDILDISALPQLSSHPKDSTISIQVLKIRINDFYRQMKSRNNIIRANCTSYFSRFFGQGTDPRKQDYIDPQPQAISKATHPYKLTLVIEKSGFNYIAVVLADPRVSRTKKSLSPLKVSQRLINQVDKPRSDFMLTSLKVLRIADNFLPPLASSSTSMPPSPNSKAKVAPSFTDNSMRVHLISSNSAANEEEISRKIKKQSVRQAGELIPGIVQSAAKDKSYRRLGEIRRNFRSEERREGGILANTNGPDPQKKIFDWLEKLRQVKELERKRILGLS